jgi:hypothetical protein
LKMRRNQQCRSAIMSTWQSLSAQLPSGADFMPYWQSPHNEITS